MRRSQRLIKYKKFADEAKCLDTSSNSIADDQIQNFVQKTDNGSNNREISLPQLFKNISDGQSIGVNNDTLKRSLKTNAELEKVNTSISYLSEESKSTKRAQNKRPAAAPTSSTTRKTRKRKTHQPKSTRQSKQRRCEAFPNEFDVKAPYIPIDNYFNPIRNPLIPVESNAQTRLNNDFYCHNNNIPTNYFTSTNSSLLPPMYPNHFVNQNYINSLFNPQQLQSFAGLDTNIQPEIHFPTPELTQSLDFDSSTSTLSLPESLRELFGCDDIREVLKLDKVVFRMRLIHLQTLAFVLNIEFDYLHSLVEKIMMLDTETLQKVAFAFQPEANLKNDTVTNE